MTKDIVDWIILGVVAIVIATFVGLSETINKSTLRDEDK
jgi:hypothetical protein